MFIGSIDRDSRLAVERVFDSFDKTKTPNVFVDCSGNFTFDRVAAKLMVNEYNVFSPIALSHLLVVHDRRYGASERPVADAEILRRAIAK